MWLIYKANIYILIYASTYWVRSMLVVLHARQLEHIIVKSIINHFTCIPENLQIDSRYFMKAQHDWEVSAHFDNEGKRFQVNLNINPVTGQVMHVSLDDPMVG